MKILVIGSGGREHALCWKLARSSRAKEVFCAPGNGGTAEVASNLPIAADDLEGLQDAVRRVGARLVVVGPEAPLVAGLADALRKDGVAVFGPSRKAAELEGSKAFAKDLMSRQGIPTAGFRVFDERGPALAYLSGEVAWPVVVKASGLAAGKGVLICADEAAAREAVDAMLVERRFGPGGERIVIEDHLVGEEISIHAITDGETLLSFPTSQDYKRALDGDLGPNTGGMGAICPCQALGERGGRRVEEEILIPTLHALKKRHALYRGMLYAGLMVTRQGPKVLEYNVRFGDPETEVLLPRLRGDLLEILLAAAEGRLQSVGAEAFDWDPRAALTVVLAAAGYPQSPRRGDPISGLEEARALPDVTVFQAGTGVVGGRLLTAGGRVLAVTALGKTLAAARERAYEGVSCIHFPGMQFRRDIGWRAFSRSS